MFGTATAVVGEIGLGGLATLAAAAIFVWLALWVASLGKGVRS